MVAIYLCNAFVSKFLTCQPSKKNDHPKMMEIQIDLYCMAVCFWYVVKRDLFSVRYCTIAYQNNTRHVYLVGL